MRKGIDVFISKKQQKQIAKISSEQQQGRNLWQDAWQRFRANKAAMVSLLILMIIVCFSIVIPYVAQHAYDATNWNYVLSPPSIKAGYLMGSDMLGRDLFVRIAIAGRISLMVGLLGALIAALVGTVYGAVSGFFGGKTDAVLMRTVDILNALPFMFFVIVLVTMFGRRISFIFLAIGLFAWIDVARVVRGQTLNLRHAEFVQAARISGLSSFSIIVNHIIPNVLGVVVVYTALLVPNMILLESFLSFLGLGVQEPMTSWGTLLQEGAQNMQVALWQLVFPGLFLIATLFSFNFIGDGLRDALDPKMRKE